MIDALISGRLIKTPELKTGQSGKHYTQFFISVAVGEEKSIVVSGIAFQEVAEKIAKLQKGDALSVSGALKPSEWVDKASNEIKHGLSVTVSNCLSVYDIQKRRKPKSVASVNPVNGDSSPFDDNIDFLKSSI